MPVYTCVFCFMFFLFCFVLGFFFFPHSFQKLYLLEENRERLPRDLIREPTQPQRRRQQEPHKFSYLVVKNNNFARFARAVFIFDISQTFSFFLRREITCFAVV